MGDAMTESSGTGALGDLDRLLADLRALSEDIDSCAVLSGDRDLLFSSHASAVDRERASALLAALVDLSDRAARDGGKDYASQVRIDTDEGHLLLVRLDGGGVLAATTGPDARVGLVLYDMRNTRDELDRVLAEGGGE
jgi:predicted regulator of Ras-like GTPase activity (Roadblock/LC7/MglB family)